MLLASASAMAQETGAAASLEQVPDTTGVTATDTTTVEPLPQVVSANPPVSGLSDVEAFKRLDDGAEGTLELEHDTVLFVRGDDAFLRSGYGRAIMLSRTGLPLETGQIILGSVTGRKESFEGGMPIFVGTEKTTAADYEVVGMTEIDGLQRQLEFQRLEKGIEGTGVQSFVGDIVVVDSMTVTASAEVDGVRRFSVCCPADSDGDVEIVDKYGYCEGDVPVGATCRGVRGILVASADRYQLYPLADISRYAVMPTGVAGIGNVSDGDCKSLQTGNETLVYDLQGRRMKSQGAKGVYIRNGRKLLVK